MRQDRLHFPSWPGRLRVRAGNRLTALALACAAVAGLAGCGTLPGASSGWGAPEAVVPPSSFHGVHGLAIDREGRLLAGTIFGNAIWEVDRRSGAARELIAGPEGQADDIAIGPRGELAWTSVIQGIVHFREHRDAPTRVLATGLPGINSVEFDQKTGKLYVAQVANIGTSDTLLEIDREGRQPPRLISRAHGGLNGFDIGPDGMIYGPLMFKGQVVKIDPADGRITPIADGFQVPSGAALDGKGNLWVVDSKSGELVRVELASGRKTLVKQLKPTLDNLVISREGTIYVSNYADNSIESFEPATGETRLLTGGKLSVPGGIKVEGDRMWVADTFAFREVDLRTGVVTDIFRRQRDPETLVPLAVGLSRTHFALASWFTGTVLMVDRATRKATATLRDLKMPYDALPMDDGSVIYLENATGVITRASGADFGVRKVLATGLQGPVQMALGRDGALYVTETAGRLSRVALDGDTPPRTIAEGLAAPEGLAQTAAGTFIVAEIGARRLVEIDPATGTRKTVAENLPIGLAAAPGSPAAFVQTGVAVGPDDTVYFSADRNNGVYRVKRR